jgi:hypothetical protein
MSLEVLKQNPQIKQLIETWANLSEEDHKVLIPYLLHNTLGWRAWAMGPDTAINWLQRRFEEVGIPMYAGPRAMRRTKRFLDALFSTH